MNWSGRAFTGIYIPLAAMAAVSGRNGWFVSKAGSTSRGIRRACGSPGMVRLTGRAVATEDGLRLIAATHIRWEI